jgi:hypothetical protein
LEVLWFWVSTLLAVQARILQPLLVTVLPAVSAGHRIVCHRLSADLAEVHVHRGLCLDVMACFGWHYLSWRLLARPDLQMKVEQQEARQMPV